MPKPGKNLVNEKIKAMFKKRDKKPKVSILIGKSTRENIGWIASDVNRMPPTAINIFLGSLPRLIVGTREYAA